MTVFSYSGRVKSPEWRWPRRTADLRHFEIFRHGPIIIYIRLPAGGTYYPICTLPASSECLISAFLIPFLPLFMGIRHLPHVLTVPPTKACLLCSTPAGMDLYIYRSMPEGSYRVQSHGFPKIVYSSSPSTGKDVYSKQFVC